jgi:hypothetical protein
VLLNPLFDRQESKKSGLEPIEVGKIAEAPEQAIGRLFESNKKGIALPNYFDGNALSTAQDDLDRSKNSVILHEIKQTLSNLPPGSVNLTNFGAF